MIRLKSLAYTSLARPDLDQEDIRAIHQSARHLNALDGVTGLLIYNGRQFLQVIEGAENAIGDLLERLTADRRHSGLTIEDQRFIDDRNFPGWNMELAQVNAGRENTRLNLADVLPPSLPEAIRIKALQMAVSQS